MKTKKNILRQTAAALMALVALTSCVKETLVDAPQAALSTDWSRRTEGVEIPGSYTVVLAGKAMRLTAPVNPLPPMQAGSYPVAVYNTAERITLADGVATVETEGGKVASSPGWLFYGTAEAVYENDKTTTVTVLMRQQVRRLDIELTLDGGSFDNVNSLSGTLHGVAGSLELASGRHGGTGLQVSLPSFEHKDGKLRTSVRLLGMTDKRKEIILTVQYKGGKTQTIASDVTEQLASFNSDKHQPLLLKSTARIFTSLDIGEMTIGAWEVQGELEGAPWGTPTNDEEE